MEANNTKQHIVWHDDAIIKQLISYAVEDASFLRLQNVTVGHTCQRSG